MPMRDTARMFRTALPSESLNPRQSVPGVTNSLPRAACGLDRDRRAHRAAARRRIYCVRLDVAGNSGRERESARRMPSGWRLAT